jgi:hypothetical protein
MGMSCPSIVGIGPPDFVVNSDSTGDHFLSNDYEADGVQLAATADGTWTTVFGATCTTACNLFGRRFDARGEALSSVVAGGPNDFPVTTTLTTSAATPAISGSGTATVVFWDYTDTVGPGTGVACRALDELGNATPGQVTISTDAADVVTAAPLSNGNYAVAWQSYSPAAIRTIIVKPDCTTVTAQPITAASAAAVAGAHVAANMDTVLYAWLVESGMGKDLHLRPASNAAIFGPEVTPILHTATQGISAVRIAPFGTGFAVVLRWVALDSVGPGRIELFEVNALGAIVGGPTLIADQTGSDFSGGHNSFGVAARSDGALMIVWHQCTSGTSSTCDVLGRIVRPTGVPVGDAFIVPTTTTGDQTSPSVVALPGAFVAAWNDSSHAPPDTDVMVVRARIVDPAYDDATAVLGAACGGTLPACNQGLTCAMGSDNTQRCFETCTPPTCPDGGMCTLAAGTTYACMF